MLLAARRAATMLFGCLLNAAVAVHPAHAGVSIGGPEAIGVDRFWSARSGAHPLPVLLRYGLMQPRPGTQPRSRRVAVTGR